MPTVQRGKLLYANPLASPADVADFRMEGDGVCTFPLGRLRLESLRNAADDQASNIVFWCPHKLPDAVSIRWKFVPLHEPGLAMLFFAASASGGGDLFSPKVKPRHGVYDQYHSSDIDTLHVSYFRRRYPSEINFHTVNLRKSRGFHLVAQGADPIPTVAQCKAEYQVELVKAGPSVTFLIDDLQVLSWHDDAALGPVRGGGHIGFRQMAPLIAEYSDLRVHSISL